MKQTTKRVLSLLCVVAMLLALVPSVFAEPTDSAEFAFYSTTDIHGKCWDKNVLNDTNENNNLLRVATVMKSERETYKNNVVLVDNGDLYQGTPVSTYQLNLLAKGESDWPAAMALCLSEIGYDMANVGNHEFNYGWDLMTKVRAYMASRGVASVCANLYYDGTDGVHAKDENAMTPYITKELTVGGRTIKIGLLGMVTPDCTRWDIPENYPGIRFSHSDNPEKDMAKEAARYIPKMKAEGCDFIAVVFHSGLGAADGELTFSVNTENQVQRVIAKNSDIDLMVAGHDHSSGYSGNYYKDKNGKDVLVVNGGGRELTKTVFTVTKDSITVKSTENLKLNNYKSDAALLEMIQPYADLASEYVNTVAGQAVGTWDSETNYYLKQSNTMDLIQTAQMFEGTKHLAEKYDTDEKKQALYKKTGLDHIDVDMSSTSVVVNGSYHVSPGEITMKDVYRMYRYDNNLYLLPLTGQQIKDVLEQNASTRLKATISNGEVRYTTIGENFTNPVFGGLNFEYDMYQPEGSRAVIHGFANGRDFDLNKTYIVGVNNYHLGNAGCGFGKYSTADAIWSQTDDMGGGVVQDLIMEFFRDQADNEKKGVDPADFFTWKWELTYSGDPTVPQDLNGSIVGKKVDGFADGKQVLLHYAGEGTVVTATAPAGANNKLAPADATSVSNYIATDAADAVFTVEAADASDDGTAYFALKNADGKYMTAAATGNGLSMTDTLTDCGKWYAVAVDGGYHIMNVGAAYGGSHNQALEYYNGFTTYGVNDTTAYLFNIYEKVDALSKAEKLENGHKYVIYFEGDGDSVIGSDFMKASATVVGGKIILPMGENAMVVTANINDAEQVDFVTEDGKHLTTGATGGSLDLTDEAEGDLSLWAIKATDGGYNIVSVGAAYNGNHNQAVEYYSGKFTTYGLQNSGIYLFSFYEVGAKTPEDPCANGHTWDDGVVTTEPTCTKAGVKTYTCTVCKETKTEAIAALGHKWDDGKVTTEPTCTEAGVKTYTCTVCKETKTEAVAALGHVDADKDNKCDRCGEKLGEDPKPTYSDFTDLDPNGWYHDGINYMIENGMMNGEAPDTFAPHDTVTRAMLVTILYRNAGSPSVEGMTNPFTDVKAGKYYTDAVIWAFDKKITNGTSETTFEPDAPVTREQIATLLYRRAGEPKVEQDLSAFSDADRITSYARAAMQWAVSEKIISGDGDRLKAQESATRAELATMLMRLLTK